MMYPNRERLTAVLLILTFNVRQWSKRRDMDRVYLPN